MLKVVPIEYQKRKSTYSLQLKAQKELVLSRIWLKTRIVTRSKIKTLGNQEKKFDVQENKKKTSPTSKLSPFLMLRPRDSLIEKSVSQKSLELQLLKGKEVKGTKYPGERKENTRLKIISIGCEPPGYKEKNYKEKLKQIMHPRKGQNYFLKKQTNLKNRDEKYLRIDLRRQQRQNAQDQ